MHYDGMLQSRAYTAHHVHRHKSTYGTKVCTGRLCLYAPYFGSTYAAIVIIAAIIIFIHFIYTYIDLGTHIYKIYKKFRIRISVDMHRTWTALVYPYNHSKYTQLQQQQLIVKKLCQSDLCFKRITGQNFSRPS